MNFLVLSSFSSLSSELTKAIQISENAENIEKTADFIVNRFEERGWKAMGEKQNITLEKVRAIVEMSY